MYGVVSPHSPPGVLQPDHLWPTSVCLVAFFCYESFIVLRDVPASARAPRIGEEAPAFALPDQNGKQVALADLLSPHGAILIFYRGHW